MQGYWTRNPVRLYHLYRTCGVPPREPALASSLHILRYPGVMAQDPESLQGPPEDDAVDTSHGLDLATIYSSQGVDSEVEADIIRGIMESNGIPAIVVRAMGYPALGFEVRV